MTTLSENWTKSGSQTQQTNVERKNPPHPFSLRLTFEERARLERDAAGMSLGAYIRSRLFDDSMPIRRTRGKFPVKDHKALGQVLGQLGKSRLANNLNQLAKAVNIGTLPVTPETEAELREACRAIGDIRQHIISALGLSSDVGESS